MINAKPKLIKIIGMNAINDDFFTKGNFDRVSSNSKDPSKTIKISPMVPKMGNTEVRLGISIPKKVAT